MFRLRIGAAAALVVALCVAIGTLEPAHAARAAGIRVATASVSSSSASAAGVPTVTVSPATGDELSVFRGRGSGFTPNATVWVDVMVNGRGYGGSYTRTHTTDASGSFSWAWIWTTGDPYGSYTLSFTDASGHAAGAGLTVQVGTPPAPPAGASLMMDTASAPSLATMTAWTQGVQRAPYDAVAVYVPVDPAVDDRHDKVQAALTPAWVHAVQGAGWHVLPVYVGLQAPTTCQSPRGAFHAMSTDPATAQAQGVAAATDAVRAATRLGIAAGAPVVYDLEGYRSGCSGAIQAFLTGWTARVHALGRAAGLYGTAVTAGRDVAAAAATDPTYLRPDVFWAASDDRSVSTAVKGLPAAGWKVAHQYLFGVERTFSAATVAVDESVVDDGAWQLPVRRADTAAPLVTMGRVPPLVRSGRIAFTWSGVDAGTGLGSYQVRTRVTRGGHHAAAWSSPRPVRAGTRGRLSVPVAPGEQVCAQVRAVDRVENRSDWTPPACTSRPADDRAAKGGGGWHRVHARHAYRHTLTRASRAHAVLRLGHAAAGRLGVLLEGRGSVVVRVGHRRVGVLTGPGTRWIALPRSGRLRLVTATARGVAVDGFVLLPR